MNTRKIYRQFVVGGLCAGALLISGKVLAQSGITLYGQVDTYVGSVKSIGQQGRTALLGGSGGMQTPFWGIKGSEDLGGSLKAIFVLESWYRPDTGAAARYNGDNFFSRSAYVGLQGRMGTIKFGRNTTPYWISTVTFNPFAGSFAFSPAIYQSYFFNGSVAAPLLGDSGWSNTVVYTTPNMAGLTANAIYAFGEVPGDMGKNKVGGNLLYKNGDLGATLAYQQVDYAQAPGDLGAAFDKQKALFAGLSYDFKVVKLFGYLQRLDNKVTTGDLKRNSAQIGLSAPLGGGSVLASYAYMKTKGTMENSRNSWAIGYDYPLSKRTDLYSAYFRDSVTGIGKGDTLGFGIRHYF